MTEELIPAVILNKYSINQSQHITPNVTVIPTAIIT